MDGANDTEAELRKLDEKLQATTEAFWDEWGRVVQTWNFKFGPIRISRVVGSQTITRTYVAFNVACFIAGILLVVAGGIPGNIGIALIVGSLFAFGTFVSQFWAVAAQREIDTSDRVIGKYKFSESERLAKELVKLQIRIEKLRQSPPDTSADLNK